MLLLSYKVVPPQFVITTNYPIMPTSIQQVIDNHNTQMAAAMEQAMQEQLRDFKKQLIETLAEKYEFDVDDAMELFPDSVVPVFTSKKLNKKDKKKNFH